MSSRSPVTRARVIAFLVPFTLAGWGTATFACGGFGPGNIAIESAGPLSGAAPLTLRVRASAQTDATVPYFACLYIDWGNGAPFGRCDFCYECDGDNIIAGIFVDEEHGYQCPGTYDVRVYTNPDLCAQCDTLRTTVTVTVPDPPTASLIPVYANDGRTCKLAVVGDIPVDYIAAVSVDWGDGSPLEPFTWRPDHYGLETPYHDYAQDGQYAARVFNSFVCAYVDLVLETPVTVPGYTTPVHTATWGAVKAMYRR